MSDQRVTKLSFYQSQLEICNEKGAICVEEEKFQLPVDVRGSKTAVHVKTGVRSCLVLEPWPQVRPCNFEPRLLSERKQVKKIVKKKTTSLRPLLKERVS